MTPNLKKLIIALVVIALLAGGYYMFFSGGSATDTTTADTSTDTTVGADILVLVQKLKAVSIDPSLFASPLLTNLKDTSVPLNPEPQGRTNPFAPAGSN